MPSARVNDIELYYEVHGEGPPVLWIPGLGVDVNDFAASIEQLATSCRVVAFDPRGAGRSDKPDEPYTIEGMADDAAGLLKLLAIEPTTVVGCSMGGRIALSLALNHQNLVERLVLAATSPRAPSTRPLTRRWFVMDVLARIPLPRSVDAQPRFAWERQRQASDAFDCSERLGEISVPTLVVHGRTDHLIPFSFGQAMADRIPGARLVALPGGHRALFTTYGERLAQEVERFVSAT
jgi:pimeloyl-ACP methyl ester carboxylesterase